MATNIAFHGIAEGQSYKVELSPAHGGSVLNPGGTSTTSSGRQYTACIASDVTPGRYQADVLQSGHVVGGGLVDVKGTGTYWIGNITQDIEVEVDVGDVSNEVAERVVDSLSNTKQIVLTQPKLIGNRLSEPIVQGDSYLFNADPTQSRSLDFSRSDFPSLSGATVKIVGQKVTEDGSESFSWNGSVVSPDGTKRVRFQPTSEQTAELSVGVYLFNVTAVFPDGNSACFVGPKAQLEVIERANIA